MEIVFTESALEDLDYWKKSGKASIQNKISSLLQNIRQTPYSGIRMPEPLKHNLSGYWSRRINKEHRFVYQVEDKKLPLFRFGFITTAKG